MDAKPSSDYHSPNVKALNATANVQLSDLTAEALMAAARKQTGLERFGDECFLPGLRMLLASVKSDASLNAYGRLNLQQNAIGFLKNRLWANACFEAHPEILQRKIESPIIIVGPHRSGTTRLQRMMATDSRLSHLRTWEGLNPAPRIDRPGMGKAERHSEIKHALAAADSLYPGAFLGHPMDADWAEEEMHLLDHSWCGFSPLGLYAGVDSYYQWFLTHDKTAAYRYMADLLRLISWSRGEADNKRWILKNPQHMLNLDTLLAVFPDAKIVFTHRDPIKTVASTMSLMWHYAVQHTDTNCRAQVRDLWLDFCEQSAHQSIVQRATIPQSQQLDIHYDAMNKDWRGTMRRLYDFAGMDFTAEAEHGMKEWLRSSESHHGGHRYSLEEFGLTAPEVDARMMFSRRHYGIPYESGNNDRTGPPGGLSEHNLIAEARAATGLERFGDESFLTGLRVMLAGLTTEANLNEVGRQRAKGAILMWLKNRLWANACFEAHPEILQRRITAPIIIVGPARSGTTRIQRLLAADKRLQHLTAWEGFNPAPRLGLPDMGRNDRHAEVKAFLDNRRRANPGAYTAHPMDADWAEEETLLLNHSFAGFAALGTFDMPSYRDWYLDCDQSDSYRYMVRLLKLISWSRGEPEDKPWLLKAPPHMLALDALLKVFPDAKLVFTHRDPIKTTGSTLSLMWAFYHQNTDTPSRETIRDIWLPLCEKMARHCIQSRERIPARQQLDVQYDDMNRDWRGVIRRIYNFAGLPFDAACEAQLGSWLEQSTSENHHGGHRYTLEEFGTSAPEVEARMRFYRERYAIPREGKRHESQKERSPELCEEC